MLLDALCARRAKPRRGLKAVSSLGLFKNLNEGGSLREVFDVMGWSCFAETGALSGLSVVAEPPGGACPRDCQSWRPGPFSCHGDKQRGRGGRSPERDRSRGSRGVACRGGGGAGRERPRGNECGRMLGLESAERR